MNIATIGTESAFLRKKGRGYGAPEAFLCEPILDHSSDIRNRKRVGVSIRVSIDPNY